jgi:hypothetical protein
MWTGKAPVSGKTARQVIAGANGCESSKTADTLLGEPRKRRVSRWSIMPSLCAFLLEP